MTDKKVENINRITDLMAQYLEGYLSPTMKPEEVIRTLDKLNIKYTPSDSGEFSIWIDNSLVRIYKQYHGTIKIQRWYK